MPSILYSATIIPASCPLVSGIVFNSYIIDILTTFILVDTLLSHITPVTLLRQFNPAITLTFIFGPRSLLLFTGDRKHLNSVTLFSQFYTLQLLFVTSFIFIHAQIYFFCYG